MSQTHRAENIMENSDDQWQDVCTLDSILPNTGICALIGDQQIAIFRVGETDEVHAIDNFDPIGHANVLSRGIVGDIQGELVVASPLYKQHFSLRSGQCLEEKEVKVKTYTTRVHQGVVQVA